jgi:hypothetical protein
MFTPTVIESRSALGVVCRDPFLEDRDEPQQLGAPAATVAHNGARGRRRSSQRALVEASLLRVPGRDRAGSRRAGPGSAGA